MKLIDKDALLAKIDGEIKLLEPYLGACAGQIVAEANSKIAAYNRVKDIINVTEVKEVDLDFMLHEYWNLFPKITIDCLESATMTKDEMINFAKHFFELGLKAQNDNIRHSMDETPNYPCDILLVTDVNNVFLCRYMENGRPVDIETPYFRGIENGKCWYYCNDIINVH